MPLKPKTKRKDQSSARPKPAKKAKAKSYQDESSDEDPFSDLDFSLLEQGMSEEEFWARKLGLNGKSSVAKERLADEFAQDGLGDDFLELFDFMDEVREEASKKDEDLPDEAPAGPGKYIPPHLRSSLTESSGSVLSKEKKSVSLLGLLNRVSEGNLDSISVEIISLLSKNKVKPGDVANAIVGIACDNPNVTVTLQGTFAAIACAIAVDTAPSNQYSGGFLAELVRRMKDESNARIIANLARFTAALFSLGLFSVDTVDSMLKYLSESTNATAEKRLDWILTCLRFSGRVMKDSHKNQFGAILDRMIATVASFDIKNKQIEFAVEELKLMKEGKSNFRAVDHLQTVAEWLVVRNASGKTKSTEGSTLSGWKVPKPVEAVQLMVPTVDVFSYRFPAEWTACTGSANVEFESSESGPANSHSLEELAAMNRMTTEVKKNAFVAIMGSIDSKHALLRLDQFGLVEVKNVPSIVTVVCHCALQEQKVNKFYLELIKSLCCEQREAKLNRKFSISLKIEFSKLISSGRLSETEVAVLSNLIAFYIQISNGEVTIQDILGGGPSEDSS